MPTATFTTIALSDGVTTLNLGSGAAYEVRDDGWAPQVAARRRDDLGGKGSYEDVDEEMIVSVLGSTGTVMLTNAAALSQMLDQADAWSAGDPAALPVYLQVQPRGSTLTSPVQALVLGRSRDALMVLPSDYTDHLVGNSIEEAHIRFTRQGTWLDTTASIGASSVTVPGSLMTCPAMPAQAIPSPMRAYLSGLPALLIPSGVFIVAPTNRFFIVDAEGMTITKWTSVSESAVASPYARLGAILRYTPTDTLPSTSAYITLGGSTFFSDVAVFAVVRNNSATTTWQLHANLSSDNLWDVGTSVSTRDYLIDATSQNPQVISLGVVSHMDVCRRISLTATASAASGTLDIDYIVAVAVPDRITNIISHEAIDASGFGGPGILQVDATTSTLSPSILLTGSGALPVTYHGDPYFQSAGTTVSGMWLACGGASAANWRCASGAGLVTTTLTTWRSPASLVPR